MNISYKQYKRALRIVEEYEAERKRIKEGLSIFVNAKADDGIFDVPLSTRGLNVLRREGFGLGNTVADISKLSIKKLKSYEGVGRKGIAELKELCDCVGLKMED